MSDDLISRKALYQELARLQELAMNRVLDTPMSSPCYNRYNAQLNERTSLKHMIADATTAYDVDKVVKELLERKEQLENDIAKDRYGIKEYENRLDEIEIITEIAKGGGIDE